MNRERRRHLLLCAHAVRIQDPADRALFWRIVAKGRSAYARWLFR